MKTNKESQILKRENGSLSVFNYTDYRSFLIDWHNEKKRQKPSWTLGVWSKKINAQSPATLTMILKGQREPSLDLARRIFDSMVLKANEREYMINLVRLKKVKDDPCLVALIIERLAESQGSKDFWIMDHEQFLLISNWYFYAIRQLTKLDYFKEDPIWISENLQFKVTPKEVTEAINIMLDQGFLIRDENKRLRVLQSNLATPNDRASEGLKRYHEQTLEHAKISLREVELHQREISGVCFPVKMESLPLAKELIRKFQKDLCQLISTEEGDAVYQLEVAMYPIHIKQELL